VKEITLNSLSGRGYEASVDLLGGVAAWWSFKDNGMPGWSGGLVGVGPAVGGSAGKTWTNIDY